MRTRQWGRWFTALVAFLTLSIIACDTSPAAPPDTPLPAQPTATISPVSAQPTSVPSFLDSTPVPRRTSAPGSSASARDTMILVTNGAPDQLGAFSPGCGGNSASLVCEDLTSDPLTWMDSASFQVVPLSGIDHWEQMAPDRWRFYLREGVTFHNGEPWNAEAAKLGVDTHGDEETAGNGTFSYGLHGGISGKVVDDLTLDVVCVASCPILPRTTMFLKFQAPAWWASASVEQRASTTLGFGPYRMVEWRPGVEVELEYFEDYRPNSAFDAQAPSIARVFQVWRDEELARASMVAAGEADFAFDIGYDNFALVPKALAGNNNEVYYLVADNLWHPELRKKQVREALNLAIDCQAIADAYYSGLPRCWGNIAPEGATGITAENSAPYPYDPDRAQQLLSQAGYNPANEIIIHSRQGRVFRDVDLWESVVTMWQDVGVNARLEVLGVEEARDLQRSGCGNFGQDALQCGSFDPPGPTFTFSHFFELATTNESMDLQRQLLLRTSCFSVSSRVCNNVPSFEDRIHQAIAAPMGPDRTAQMEALAQTIYDEHWFVPMFQVVNIYGVSENVEWAPRHDPRLRVNTMRFTQ